MSKSPFAFIQDKILVMLAMLSKHNTKCVTPVTRKVLNVFSLGCSWSSFESSKKWSQSDDSLADKSFYTRQDFSDASSVEQT